MIFRLFLKCKIYRRTFHVQNSKLSPALGALMDLRSDSLGGGASVFARVEHGDDETMMWRSRTDASPPKGILKSSRRTISSSFFRPPKPDHDLRACIPSREFVSPYLGAAYTCSLARSISIFFLQTYMCVCAIVYTSIN